MAAARVSISARSRSETKTLSGRFLSRLSSTFHTGMASALSFPARVSALVEPKASKKAFG